VCGAADARGQGAAAGIFSVVVDARYPSAQVDAFCDALQFFKLGYSWGGPESLVVPYDLASMRHGWPEHIQHGTVVRLVAGLEAEADLQADLAQALARALPR
jgi:cystathionine beta-lyase